ncbi:MAG: site-specific integrase, partial [Thermoproteota archaeon]|nr:site-specific integrase [Thermoproteota archaeon]
MELEGKSFRRFIDAQKSSATKEAYAFFLYKYIQWRNIKGNNTDILLKDKDIQDNLIEYISYLKGKGLRYSTMSAYCAGVIAFYDLNNIDLNSKRINRYLGESQPPIENRAYSREETAKILEYCDERTRAIILILCSCGCRINALPTLKMKDLVMIPEYNLYQIWLYSDSNDKYYSYITPEATKALKAYLDFREVCGEKLHKKSVVIRKEFDRKNEANDPKPLSSRGFEEAINDILIRAGLRKVQHTGEGGGKVRNEVKLTSGFRKFFNTKVEKSKVRPLIKEMLMGHN